MLLLAACASAPVAETLPPPGQNARTEADADQAAELVKEGNLPAAEQLLRKAADLAPRDPAVLGNLASVLAMEKKFEESTDFFERALAIDPGNVTLRRYLAANQWQLHRFPEAKQNLQIVLKEKPGDQPTMLLLGMVSENMKDYATAAKMLAAVPALVHQQPESIAALARSYYHIGRRQEARATLDELQTHPAGTEAVLLGTHIADEMHDYEEAKKLLASIPTTSFDQATVGYSLALVEYHAKQFDESQQTLLQMLNAGTKSSQIYNLLGWCYQQQRQAGQATDAMEQAIRLDPAQESNFLDLGQILLANGSLPAALALARRTVQAFPDSSSAYVLKGETELKVSQFTDAIDSYSAALRLDPASAAAALGLAKAQFGAGRIKDATASFEAGTRKFPRDARFPLQYALALLKEADTGNAHAGALAGQLLKSALALDPSLAEAHYQLGVIALNRGQDAEALAHLRAAAKLDPASPATHFALSRLYRRLGRKLDSSNEMALYQKLEASQSPPTSGQADEQPPN